LDKKESGFFWRLYYTDATVILSTEAKTIDELPGLTKLVDFTSDNPEKLGDPGLNWNIFYENASQRLWFVRGIAIQVTEGPNYPETPGTTPENNEKRRYFTAKELYGTDSAIIHSLDLVADTIYGTARRQSQGGSIVFKASEDNHPVPDTEKAMEILANRTKGA
jgi:hypothetical protein